jgi:hypothetical protein
MGHLRYDLIMIPTGYFLMQFGYGKIIFIFQHRFYPNHLFLNYLNDPRNLTYGSLLVTKLICPGEEANEAQNTPFSTT